MSVFDRDDFLFYFSPGSGWTAPVGGPPTFSRASVAHRVNRAGVLEEIEADYPRRHWGQDENGLWRPMAKLEASRTNEIHNSTSPATQTRSLTAGTYTLWIEGTGSVDADGATDGAYGTATEGQANDLTFTVSATQNVTFTVNGSVTRFQCELGSFRSSFITTAGAAVTRSADSLSFDISGTPLATPQALTAYAKIREPGSVLGDFGAVVFSIRESASGNWLNVIGSGAGQYRALFADNGGNSSSQSGAIASVGDIAELRFQIDANADFLLGVSINGGTEDLGPVQTNRTFESQWSTDQLRLINWGTAFNNPGFADFISLKIASGVRTMDEMRALDDASSDILFQTDFTLSMSEGEFVELDMGDGTITDEAGGSEVSSMDTGSDFPWHLEPIRGEQQSGDYPLVEVTDGDGMIEFFRRWQ